MNSNIVEVKPVLIGASAKPFLKWAGGKSQLLPILREHYPIYDGRYHEPFLGGGAVFFDHDPVSASLNDINTHLINSYEHIRDNIEEVISHLISHESTFFALSNSDDKKDYYYKYRELFNRLDESTPEKAALLIFLNKTGYNGMYRENSNGKLNIPFGGHPRRDIRSLFDTKNLYEVSDRLQNANLTSDSFINTVNNAKKGDFLYLDPPYIPISATSNFTEYTKHIFGLEDQRKVRDIFTELTRRGCFVLLSNSDHPVIRDLYKKFEIIEVMASRSLNCKSSGRGKIVELLIKNY